MSGWIDAGARFDWITPLVTLVRVTSGAAAGYNVYDCGWSAYAVRDLLRRGGVTVAGLQVLGDVITFRVPADQAKEAESIMSDFGIDWAGG